MSRAVILRATNHGILSPLTVTRKLEVIEDSNFDGDVMVNGTVDCNQLYVNGHNLLPSGTVVSFISTTAPAGWLVCDGSSYLRSSYPTLSSILGSTFGGDETHFTVPDLRGRTVIGSGTGTSLSARSIAEKGGKESHTLTVDELPAHTHTGTTSTDGSHTHSHNATGENDGKGLVQDTNTNTANSTDTSYSEFNLYQLPQALTIDSAGSHSHTFTSDSTGSGNSHNLMQPYLVLNYIIKL